MSVDLKRLPTDEEIVRLLGKSDPCSLAIQNVLDGLNWFRCKAKFAEQELARRPDDGQYGDWKFHQDHDQ